MRATSLGEAEIAKKGCTARIFGGAFVLALVDASERQPRVLPRGRARPSLGWGIAAGALAGVGWVATSLGITYLFERKPLSLYLIDAGYHVVSFILSGAGPRRLEGYERQIPAAAASCVAAPPTASASARTTVTPSSSGVRGRALVSTHPRKWSISTASGSRQGTVISAPSTHSRSGARTSSGPAVAVVCR